MLVLRLSKPCLIGALMALMFSLPVSGLAGSDKSSKEDAKQEAAELKAEAKAESKEMKESAKEMKESAREEAKELKEEAKEMAREAKEQAREEAKELKEEAKEEAREIKEQAKEAAKEAKEAAKEEAKELKEEAKEMAREAREEAKQDAKDEIKEEAKEVLSESIDEIKNEVKEDLKVEVIADVEVQKEPIEEAVTAEAAESESETAEESKDTSEVKEEEKVAELPHEEVIGNIMEDEFKESPKFETFLITRTEFQKRAESIGIDINDTSLVYTDDQLAALDAIKAEVIKLVDEGAIKLSQRELISAYLELPEGIAEVANNLSAEELTTLATSSGHKLKTVEFQDFLGKQGGGLIYSQVVIPISEQQRFEEQRDPGVPINIHDTARRTRRGDDGSIIIES